MKSELSTPAGDRWSAVLPQRVFAGSNRERMRQWDAFDAWAARRVADFVLQPWEFSRWPAKKACSSRSYPHFSPVDYGHRFSRARTWPTSGINPVRLNTSTDAGKTGSSSAVRIGARAHSASSVRQLPQSPTHCTRAARPAGGFRIEKSPTELETKILEQTKTPRRQLGPARRGGVPALL